MNGANVGFGYASFLLGQVDEISISEPDASRGWERINSGSIAQDTWKVTRRFTLDYGLRYDYSTYLREQYGRAPAVFAHNDTSDAGHTRRRDL